MPRTPKPCGTAAAYWRHLDAGEEPCQIDRDAVNAYQEIHRQARDQLGREFPGRLKELRAGRAGHNPAQDALLALVREQYGRFTEIFTDRKRKAGV